MVYGLFKKEPKESHMMVVKIILWYLKGTIDYGLWYPYKGYFTLDFFTDVDWAGNVDDNFLVSQRHNRLFNYWSREVSLRRLLSQKFAPLMCWKETLF